MCPHVMGDNDSIEKAQDQFNIPEPDVVTLWRLHHFSRRAADDEFVILDGLVAFQFQRHSSVLGGRVFHLETTSSRARRLPRSVLKLEPLAVLVPADERSRSDVVVAGLGDVLVGGPMPESRSLDEPFKELQIELRVAYPLVS